MSDVNENEIADARKGGYSIFEAKDVERVDPVKYFKEVFIVPQISVERRLIQAYMHFPDKDLMPFLYKKKLPEWEKEYQRIIEIVVPPNFLALLTSTSKKDQVRLMKEQSITPDQLIAFIFKAWNEFGFTFTTFSAEHYHNGLNTADLPKLIHVKGDAVEKIGSTSLSDGQMKQLVEHRKVTVTKLLEKGDEWHCLFVTYKSLRGEESWKGGQPHLHYISDKFGIPRETVINDLKSKYYSLNTLPHIDLLEYGEARAAKAVEDETGS
jgi:hypothetical protein